jgi:hypothetical protein
MEAIAEPGPGQILSQGAALDYPQTVPGDAAFAIPGLFDLLEAEGWDYAIGIKANPKLHEQVAFLTKRPPGRPPNHVVCRYTSFHYRVKSWSKARRIVAKIEFHPGELFPKIGFIVTNRSLPNERV